MSTLLGVEFMPMRVPLTAQVIEWTVAAMVVAAHLGVLCQAWQQRRARRQTRALADRITAELLTRIASGGAA